MSARTALEAVMPPERFQAKKPSSSLLPLRVSGWPPGSNGPRRTSAFRAMVIPLPVQRLQQQEDRRRVVSLPTQVGGGLVQLQRGAGDRRGGAFGLRQLVQEPQVLRQQRHRQPGLEL